MIKLPPPSGREDFLRYFEAFLLAQPELSGTRFGALAAADAGFMWRLRKGANYSIDKLERAVEFTKSYDSAAQLRLLRGRKNG